MKKIIPILALFLFGVVNLMATMTPIRVSVVTTPFTNRDVYIDILSESGGTPSPSISRITKTGLSTDAAGVLSFVINEGTWTGLNYSTIRNLILKISYNPVSGPNIIVGLQRVEDVINQQGLFGSLIDPNEVDPTGDYNFHSLRVGPDADGHYMTIPFGSDPLELSQMVLKDDGDLAGTNGNFLNKITFDAPEDVFKDYSLIFPSAEPEDNLSVLRWNNGSLEWALPLYHVSPEAGLAYAPPPEATFFDDGTIYLMADIDGTTLKFDNYNEVSLGGTNYVYVPEPSAKIIVNQNNPFNWKALHVFASGLRDSIQNGGPHWAIGYQHDLNSWFNGVQSFIYEAGDGGSSLRESFYSGAVTSGNDDASVIVHHDTYGEGTTTEEIGMRLPEEESGFVAEPVLYIIRDHNYTFGVDIYGNVKIQGVIENDGVLNGSDYTNSVVINDELLVNSTLRVNGFVTFAAGGNSYTFPEERGTDGQILTTNGSGNLSWANLPTISLQSAYNGGRTINAPDGPVRILDATHVGGGLDVYASGAALDAIDAQLDGTSGVTQAAVQGIYRLGAETHYGYLGGNMGTNIAEGVIMNITAGAIGSTGSDISTSPFGALGVTATVDGHNVGTYAGLFVGNVSVQGAFSINLGAGNFYTFPLSLGTANQVLTTDGSGTLSWENVDRTVWGLGGNAPIDGTSFLGTTNDWPLVFKVKGYKAGEVSTGTNTSFGYLAINPSSTGSSNTAFGYEALSANTGGSANTAIGSRALYTNTDGTYNTAIGYWAMVDNTIGQFNTAVGYMALNTNKANSRSTAIGLRAMYWADDQTIGVQTHNTAVGYEALLGSMTPANNTGTHNTALGDEALWSNTNGSRNTAVGDQALRSNTWGTNSTAVGYRALQSSNGYENTAIGADAGNFYSDGTTPASACSTSVYIGAYTKAQTPSGPFRDNETVIGYGAIGNGTNTVTLGNTQVETTYLRGNVIIPGDIFAESNRFEINNVVSGLPVMKIYKPVGGSDVLVYELGYGSNPSGDFNSGYGMIIKDDNGDFRAGSGMNYGQWVTGVQGGGSIATPATYWAGARTTGGADASLGIMVNGTTVMFGADQNGDVTVGNNLSVANEIRLNEPSGSGTEYAAFKSPALANNNTYTLPNSTGTVGQVLTIASRTATTATLDWSNGNLSVSNKTVNYTLTLNDNVIIFTGSTSSTFTLPAASATNKGKIFYIYNKTTNALNIQVSSSGTWYDYMGTTHTAYPIFSGNFISDGNNWIMISGYISGP
jgi:hypothetical protein